MFGTALAQTWDGGGADNLWTTVANWNPDGAPANNGTANVIFGGTVRLQPVVNVAQDILSLTFDNTAGNFTIVQSGGATLTLRAGGITNNDTDTQQINAPIVLLASQQWFASFGALSFGAPTINLNANTLTLQINFASVIGSAISGAGGTIIKSGTDTLTLFQATTYTGGTEIAAGTLRLGGNNILGDTTTVSLTGGTAVLDVNGFTDTMGALSGTSANAVLLLPTSSSLTTNFAGGGGTFPGVFNGASGATFTKVGTGNLGLSGVHTFPGTYRINGGQITLTASERLDNAADIITNVGSLLLSGAITETVDVVTLQSGSISGSLGTLIASALNVESGNVSCHLSGAATLTKSTAGDVLLQNTNTYTGGTIINAGSLTLGAINTLLDSGAVTVNSGGTLVVNFGLSSNTIGALSGNGNVSLLGNNALSVGGGDATSTFSGVISGNGNLGKTGTGTLTLSGANTYQGNTAIFAGELRLGNNDVISDASSVNSNPGTTFNLNGFSDRIRDLNGSVAVSLGTGTLTVAPLAGSFYSGIMSGTGNLTVNGATLMTLTGANTYTGATTVSSGTLRIGASDRLEDTSDLTISGGTFDLQSFNETVDVVTLSSGSIIGSGTLVGATYFVESGSISARLGGTGGMNKNTGGTVTLSGANTYTGSTNVNAGTLALGASEVITDATFVNMASGATLDLAGFSETVAGVASVGNAGSVLLGSGTLTVGVGDVSTGFGGVISGSGNLGKIGTGTYSLSGANTYTGTTLVSAGAIKLDASNVLADASDVTVSGGSLDLQSFSDTVDIVTLGSGAITGTGTLTGSAYNVQSGTISAPLAGAAALTKSTAGTVTLGASNSYTGGTNLLGGVLEINSDANLGTGGSLTFDAGTLRTTNSFTLNRPITLNAGGGTLDTLATTTLTGTIAGPGGLTKTGLGVLILNIVSPQLAALTVNAGDLDLPVGGSLNVTGAATIGASGFFFVDGGLITAGNFNNSGEIELLNGARLVGPMSNSGVLGGEGRITGALTNNSAGQVRVGTTETLHFATTSAGSNAGEIEVIEGEIEFDGALTNSASTGLIFARDATLRFDGGLTNAGSVALSFGVSDLFGDITNNSAASIVVSGNGDATFIDDVANNGIIRTSAGSASVFFGAVSGTGSFPGTGTVFLEGDLRPGASPAQVSFGGDVVLGSFSRTEIELAGTTPGTGHDKLVIAGQASLDGTLDVVLIDGFVPTGGDSFTVMTYGSRVGDFAAVNLPTVPGLRIRLRQDATSATVLANFKGDMNCDGLLNVDDIPPFTLALTNPDVYNVTFAACDIFIGDMNDDGLVDGRDVQGFLNALLGQ